MEAMQLDELLVTERDAGPTPQPKRRSVKMKALVPPRACVSRAATSRGMRTSEHVLAIIASLFLAFVMFSRRLFS
jgi:hypothetical protein